MKRLRTTTLAILTTAITAAGISAAQRRRSRAQWHHPARGLQGLAGASPPRSAPTTTRCA
ncbi:MAG: hypothetical protein MZW92_39485 [Comamonadaceae bacterium]|nr:hypothetical protein [Comamonadaceae bacterium]